MLAARKKITAYFTVICHIRKKYKKNCVTQQVQCGLRFVIGQTRRINVIQNFKLGKFLYKNILINTME